MHWPDPTYVVLLGLAVALALCHRPAEDNLPFEAGRPMPELRSLEGLSVDPRPGLPAWRAEVARPGQAGPALTLAGAVSGLDLEQVRITVGEGLVMRAAGGHYESGRLELGPNVRITRQGRELLVAASAVMAQGECHFPGIVVLAPVAGEGRTERDWRVSLPELWRALR